MIYKTDAKGVIIAAISPIWNEFCPDLGFEEALARGWPMISSDWHYLLFVDDEYPKGMFVLQEHDDHIEIHAVFNPNFRGKHALRGAREAFEWIFDNTDYNVIVTKPDDKPHLRHFAATCGMKRTDRGYEYGRC